MELWQTLGNLHPKLVQFPLVLLLAGLLFDAIGLIRRDTRFNWAAVMLSGAGTVFLLLAFVCGIYAEIWAGRAGVPQDPIEWHEFLANVASWGFVVLMAWRVLIPNGRISGDRISGDRRLMLATYTTIGLFYYVLLVMTAYFGGQLVFSYGAAVVGGQANTVLSLHDLNTLATRQTELNLNYSELMHHIFGWMTLALSGSLLANAAFPTKSAKLRWVGPTLLLLGGVFLFFFADLDLYRLTDLRQLRDREVQLHKTIAIIMSVVGAMGLRRKSSPPERGEHARRLNEDSTASGKPIALMALIGGGLLFTHVHTVAPYANVAAGVYVQHMILGIIALSIGAARLLQDVWPDRRRLLAIGFASLMCVESMLLITYNEGLPWYLGYGRYTRTGPHQGTIAPLGATRAELTYDNSNHRLDLFLLDRFKDQPVPVDPAANVNVMIARGYSEVSVPLDPIGPRSEAHFDADAPWMKDTAAFSARVNVLSGEHRSSGFFDPWVASVIAAVPPNEVAKFQCPMHDGILSEQAGKCPVCGMTLVPIQIGVRTVLHDSPYGLKFDSAADPSGDALSQQLTLTPTQDGQLIHDLPVVHEHPMHLTIVSQDLKFFAHVHPQLQSDGSLVMNYRFPAAGNYLLYAEFMPDGQRDQVFRFPLAVNTNQLVVDDNPPLTATIGDAKPIADFPQMTAELICQPRTPSAGTHTMLMFRLTDRGQPVTDLEDYMGAMGHCAIISQDTQMFLHCHPEQLYPPSKDSRGGPVIAFHTLFPKAGKYKVWAQFQRGGKIVVADFVLDVHDPIVPAGLVNFILND